MRAQRIKSGFHRAGVVLAALIVGIGLLWFWDNYTILRDYAIAAAIAYAIMWGIGWIVAGFAGDGDR